MRILVITDSGGFPSRVAPQAGIFWGNFLKRLRPRVERIVVVSPQPLLFPGYRMVPKLAALVARPRHECWGGIEAFRPSYVMLARFKHLWLLSRAFAEAARPVCGALHRRHRFDVVIGYQLTLAAHAAQTVAHDLGLPSVCWAIGSDVNTVRHRSAENARFLRHVVRHADVILTESDALRRTLLRTFPGSKHVHTFYKGIDLDGLRAEPDRTALRRRLGLDPQRTYILSAGAVIVAKGVYEYYEAFKSLAASYPKLSAVWVGDGPETAALRRRARDEGLAQRFAITGMVPRPRVLEYMLAADVMAFPSHSEGLPNVVMEALAAGLPTVATDVGGVSEVVLDGGTGLLAAPRDVPSLVDAVRRFLEDPAFARRTAEQGRRLIHTHFDANTNARLALQILRRIAAGRTRRRARHVAQR